MRNLTPSSSLSPLAVNEAGGVEAIDRLRFQLLIALQTHIELDALIGSFAHHMKALFGISGVNFVAVDPDIRVTTGETALHHCAYNLSTEDSTLGGLSLYSRKRLTETNLMLIEIATSTLVYPLRNALLYRDSQVKAHRDPLTSLGNRLAMNAALKREVSRARRHSSELSVLMIDIDHFKRINDKFGHATGDRVLADVANVLRNTAREADNAFRFGGEEFLILLDGTNHAGAKIAAERLRQQVADQQPDVGRLLHRITVSVGCATLRENETSIELTERADAALYQAKASGRNCIHAA